MKESAFTLLVALGLVVIGFIVEDIQALAAFTISFGFLLVSSICRAIEKNGREL